MTQRSRALDEDRDWSFGKGRQSFVRNIDAVTQDVATRIRAWVDDCFFARGDGIDYTQYFQQRGSQKELETALTTRVINTGGVNGVSNVFFELGRDRVFNYRVTISTIYGETTLDETIGV